MSRSLIDALLAKKVATRLAVATTAAAMEALAAGDEGALWRDGQLVRVQAGRAQSDRTADAEGESGDSLPPPAATGKDAG
jgi:hypothetical protein